MLTVLSFPNIIVLFFDNYLVVYTGILLSL